jgi:hypothetical protein
LKRGADYLQVRAGVHTYFKRWAKMPYATGSGAACACDDFNAGLKSDAAA